MKCIMEPCRWETRGAVVTMLDVTDEVRKGTEIKLVGLQPQ